MGSVGNAPLSAAAGEQPPPWCRVFQVLEKSLPAPPTPEAQTHLPSRFPRDGTFHRIPSTRPQPSFPLDKKVEGPAFPCGRRHLDRRGSRAGLHSHRNWPEVGVPVPPRHPPCWRPRAELHSHSNWPAFPFRRRHPARARAPNKDGRRRVSAGARVERESGLVVFFCGVPIGPIASRRCSITTWNINGL